MERRISARFGRLAMAFDEVAKLKPCESSGSEHSPDSPLTDLSDLVNSFLEEDDSEKGCNDRNEDQDVSRSDSDELWPDSETRDELGRLMSDDSDESRKKIINEVEMAMGFDGVGFDKRKLMTKLRERGFDVGICKSKWDKTCRTPAGEFDYMDINMSNTRYIIELNLASQFEIARQTKGYTTLLDMFPKIYVGNVEELKRVVRIMCAAIKVSLKSARLPVAPWRRNGYMTVKWFGSYKRTTNAVSDKVARPAAENEVRSRSVGFEFDGLDSRRIVYGCGNGRRFAAEGRARLGQLAAAFSVETLS